MRNIGLLANPGGYDGTSGELSDDEKKRLRAMAALQMGASMLANNQGNYGAFAPVLGVGLQNGLASYQMNKAVMQKDAEQRRLAEASRNAFQNAFTPPTRSRYNIGQSQTATPEDAAIQSGNAPGTFGLFSDMGVAPNITAAMDGKPMPKSQFNLQDYTMPKQDVVYTPAHEGQLDFAKLSQNLMAAGYPTLQKEGIDLAVATQPKPVEPKLETVYDKNGVPRQVWLKPNQTLEQGVQVGYGKPDAESYKERTISPDSVNYVKQYSLDGGRTWKPIEGSTAYPIRAASGGSDVRINNIPASLPLEKAGQNAVDTALLDSGARKLRLNSIATSYSPEYLNLGTQAQNAISAAKQRLGGKLTPEQDLALAKYTEFKIGVQQNLNAYIKEVTGAALSEPEAKRIIGSIPNTDMSSTQFKAAFDRTVRELKMAEARLHYIKAKGLRIDSADSVSLQSIPVLMKSRASQIRAELVKQKMPSSEIDNQVRNQLAAEFGLIGE